MGSCPKHRLSPLLAVVFLVAYALPLRPNLNPHFAPAGWPTSPAWRSRSPRDELKAPHVPGELLVKWRTAGRGSEAQGAIGTLLASLQATVIKEFPVLGVARLRLPESQLQAALTRLQTDPRVEWAEPNYLLSLDFAPDDPYYANYQSDPKYGGYLLNMEMEAAWDLSLGDPSVVIAIIDTGLDFDHEDLAGSVWTNEDEVPDNGLDDDHNGYVDDVHGWDFVEEDNLPQDLHGHGTHVAGVVAARTDNGLGIAGMAGQATIMPLGIFQPQGIGTYADLIEAILYATDNGAQVINMSLGAVSYSRGEEAAVNYAWEHGVVLVAAAGNNNNDAFHYPAAHANVIAVSAVDAQDRRASFSSYGDFVDLAAPGVRVISCSPGSNYGLMSGTSMASPHVAGLAALIRSRNPTLTNAEVRQILESTADDLGTAGWDRYYGYGRINGRRALEATPLPTLPIPTPTPPPPPQPLWPPYCQELVANGDFEGATLSPWEVAGEAALDEGVAYSGDRSLRLAGIRASTAEAWQWLQVPKDITAATLFFAFRIYNHDHDFGSDPRDPFDDHLKAWFRNMNGKPLIPLLRAGNTSDAVPDGLPWDEYFYRLTPEDLDRLRYAGLVQLYFYADNNDDDELTLFHVDGVRFCISRAGIQPWAFMPLVL